MSARWWRLALCAALALGCAHGAGASTADPSQELPGAARRLPTRLRRLTNLELERSVGALLQAPAPVRLELPPDVRREGYTPNADQDVPAAWAVRYSTLVRELARSAARERAEKLAPCPTSACSGETIARLGRQAFRRPLSPSEQQGLAATFAEGGLELLLRALLESPHFLYLSELGGAPDGGVARLTEHEIASVLAFTLRGAPPDEELLSAADQRTLSDPERRVFHARRLLGQSDTREHFQRFVLEWLEVDELERTAKSETLYPDYERLKPLMLAETTAFVDEVMVHAGASLRALLSAGFASVEPKMARFYGLTTYGPRARLGNSGRLGILQQASFLAAHSHEDVTSPVKRGDFVMRKLLCQKVRRPAEIGLEVVMPPPSKSVTTRQRFAAHSSELGCASCHETLDAIGFTFEGFDAMGGARQKENGHPIDSRARVELFGQSLELGDSLALTRAVSEDPRSAECFARHAFRYFSAQNDPRVEASFIGLRQELEPEQSDSLFEALIAYVQSDLFVEREVTP
jgi:hypothetical protein